MNTKEFAQMVRDGIHPVVVCLKSIEDAEGYLEPGMRCRITGAEIKHDDVFVFTFDLTGFEAFNKPFETSNYFGKNGKANLNAHEAGQYKTVDTVYIGSYDCDFPFEVETAERLKVYNAYLAEKSGKTYTQWLEDRVADQFQEGSK